MRSLRPLLVAVPAFALGCLLTATLTTTAQAKPTNAAAPWEYRVARNESEMMNLTRQGWEYVGESAAQESTNEVDRRYTLRKRE